MKKKPKHDWWEGAITDFDDNYIWAEFSKDGKLDRLLEEGDIRNLSKRQIKQLSKGRRVRMDMITGQLVFITPTKAQIKHWNKVLVPEAKKRAKELFEKIKWE